MKGLIVLPIILLSGCAHYQYTSTIKPDGTKECKIETSSVRDIDMARLTVGSDCSLEGSADALTTGEAMKSLIELLNKVAK